jgi:RNA polymerase sigma-70 factor (ECF subfamily)
MTSDKQLLKNARAFDQKTLADIYDQYSPKLYRYAIRLLGDDTQAEDCVAETFSRFLKALDQGGGPKEHLQAYLFRIAHNWITDQYRRNTPVPLEQEDPVESNSQADPESIAEDVFLQDQVRDALKEITPDQRQVIVLKFVEGWSNPEVAKALGKPVGAIKSLQHRGLAALRRILID